MVHAAFMQILWGLVFVFVDITLGEVDVLPDIVGYVLIFMACARLSDRSAAFAKARPHIVAAGVLSLFEALSINPFELVGLSRIVADALIVWYLCTGIMDLALECADVSLANTAETRRKLFFVTASASLAVGVVMRLAPDLAVLLVMPLVMFNLIVGALILLLLRRASLEIG